MLSDRLKEFVFKSSNELQKLPAFSCIVCIDPQTHTCRFRYNILGKLFNHCRHFHGYCDLSDRTSVEKMRVAIIERESRPVRAMTREERLEHIWSSTADDYRGYAGERWPDASRCCYAPAAT